MSNLINRRSLFGLIAAAPVALVVRPAAARPRVPGPFFTGPAPGETIELTCGQTITFRPLDRETIQRVMDSINETLAEHARLSRLLKGE